MTAWFRKRNYKHFDRPVCLKFAEKAMDPSYVKQHPFSPLLFFVKKTKRYKAFRYGGGVTRKITFKNRELMYASHRDACILTFYAHTINSILERFYEANGLDRHVIAYRSLGKSNYHFSAEALQHALENMPCVILSYDVTDFFGSLDHRLLKLRLKTILKVKELDSDWYNVFKFVTKYTYIRRSDLESHPVFAARLKQRNNSLIATVKTLKLAEIPFLRNKTVGIGIPQGTPVSASLSNVYMIDFDLAMVNFAEKSGSFYRRYSDDILLIVKEEKAEEAEQFLKSCLSREALSLSEEKTERNIFEALETGQVAQYLGFTFDKYGAAIRPSSLARQWRKMRKSIRKTEKMGLENIIRGKSKKIYTKKLRRRFGSLPFRNFSSYARRSAAAFGNRQKISRQIKRIEREFERQMERLARNKAP